MAQAQIKSLLDRNVKYAETYRAPPALAQLRQLSRANATGSTVILTCADPRVVPEDFFDLKRPEVGVVRNAGGRAVDAMRSLQVLDTVGNLGLVVVVHHTDCGGLMITDDDIRQRMNERNPGEAYKAPGAPDWGLFSHIGVDESVRRDVAFIRKAPFLRKDLCVVGYVLDIETGLLREVL